MSSLGGWGWGYGSYSRGSTLQESPADIHIKEVAAQIAATPLRYGHRRVNHSSSPPSALVRKVRTGYIPTKMPSLTDTREYEGVVRIEQRAEIEAGDFTVIGIERGGLVVRSIKLEGVLPEYLDGAEARIILTEKHPYNEKTTLDDSSKGVKVYTIVPTNRRLKPVSNGKLSKRR